jgi:hypothetical protein
LPTPSRSRVDRHQRSFTESKELIAGYWILQVKSREEAIAWAKRIPAEVCAIGEIELRPLHEREDVAAGISKR